MEIEAFMTKQVYQVPIGTTYMEVFAWAFDIEIVLDTWDRALTAPTFS